MHVQHRIPSLFFTERVINKNSEAFVISTIDETSIYRYVLHNDISVNDGLHV
jgi:hypothetical protein